MRATTLLPSPEKPMKDGFVPVQLPTVSTGRDGAAGRSARAASTALVARIAATATAVNGQVSLFHMLRWRPDVAIFVGCGCAGAGAAVGGGGGPGAQVGPGGVSGPISIPGVGIRGMDRLSALTAKVA